MISFTKKIIKIPFIVVTIVLASSCVPPTDNSARCNNFNANSDSAKPDKYVGIVLAPTANFIDFDTALNSARPQIDQLLDREAVVKVSMSFADSKPAIDTELILNFPKALTGVDRDELVDDLFSRLDNVVGCLTGEYSQARTSSEESDQLAAIQALSTSMSGESGQKTIFVIGNGINTTGQLNFVNNFPAEGAATKAVAFKEKGSLPNLTGIDFFWFGLGQTDGVLQQPLELQSITSLVDFWSAIIIESGGNASRVSAGSLVNREPGPFTIPVSQIEIASRAPCINLTLTEEDGFNFKPDEANFLDLALAINGAQQIAANIESKRCSSEVTVTGFVASGTSKVNFESNPDAGKVLSQKRAEAFKQLLIQAGVKVPIKAIGGGKGPVDDWDANGNFNEDLGRQNRKVVITQ